MKPNPAFIIEVTGGRFHCDSCGATWAGTWHGDKNLMTCLVCKKPMFEEHVDET